MNPNDIISAGDQLGKMGVTALLGVIVVVLGYVAYRLGTRLLASFEQRLTDARADTKDQLKVTSEVTDTLRDLKIAMDKNNMTMAATLDALKARV